MKILPSHKDQFYYLEHSKIVKIDNKVAYTKDNNSIEKFFAIPYANVAVILLGPGTSITQAAMHHLVSEGVMVCFSGGDGFPVFAGSLSEYRPTKYCQMWIKAWEEKNWRLEVAKKFQSKRVSLVNQFWPEFLGIHVKSNLENIGNTFIDGINISNNSLSLLGYEANYAKSLYKTLSLHFKIPFSRNPQLKNDLVNDFIDSHNYYAYGIAGTVLWTMGIPFAFPVLHGETRKGALVFDLADIIKDAFLLPVAFNSAEKNLSKGEHKKECSKILNLEKTMKILFNEIKNVLEKEDKNAQYSN